MAPEKPNRRRDKRLDLTLPVRFSREPEDTFSPFEGVTHNVSSGGVYFEAAVGQMTAADTVWVRIAVPASPGEDKQNLTLAGSGMICRVERLPEDDVTGSWPEMQRQQGIYGIAVQFDQRPTVQLQSFEELLWEK